MNKKITFRRLKIKAEFMQHLLHSRESLIDEKQEKMEVNHQG